jgi:probable F420-dependent oxidoreductase
VKVASGIVSVWQAPASVAADAVTRLEAAYPGRFLLGLGASHAALVENYSRPYSRVVEYLDALDALTPTVDKDRRIIAALGPRMLSLAGSRASGAHPYFVPVEHTAMARQVLGSGSLLAPEVTVVLERDPDTARQRAKGFTAGYLSLPNYANNLRSLGYSEDDLKDGGSNRLVDAVVSWGSVDAVASRIREHHAAGADHVCIQVIPDATGALPLAEYRELAPALLGD